MCGIVGLYSYRERRQATENELRAMAGVIRHRGPDDDGFLAAGPVGLGMRRLSIIDVAGGHQPICNEGGSISVVFNGEIYNYRTLRAELEAAGHLFRTASDTESIVHAYEEYGVQFLDRLRGMFALAIWDERRQNLLIARDRLGIKPLYYWHRDGMLIFGSEVKALLAHPEVETRVNPAGVLEHFAYRFALAPQTVFDGILKLPPGHALVCSEGGVDVRRYWQLPDIDDQRAGARGWMESVEEVRQAVTDAVRSHLVSDVPVGAFLSGGVDSSIVVGLMASMRDVPVKTYSVGFGVGAPTDELHFARQVARHFGTDHHELDCRAGSVKMLRDIVWHLEEPILDPACIPTYLVAQFARAEVAVVLTGEGSDEANAGYHKYLALASPSPLATAFQQLPRSVRRAAQQKFTSQRAGLGERLRRASAYSSSWQSALDEVGYRPYAGIEPDQLFAKDAIEHLAQPASLVERFESLLTPLSENVDRLIRLDFSTWLPDDLLVKVDKMSMAHSLEARVPYLDHIFVELAATIPARFKVRAGQTKRLLRHAFADMLPPDICRRPQHGFDVPFARWFRRDLREYVHDLLLGCSVRRAGLFDPAGVAAVVKRFMAGDDSLALLIYGLVVFHTWYGCFIAAPRRDVA